MTTKRTDYISWDEYFMAVAQLSAWRSKDPNTQVGACIVNKTKRIIGIGYNKYPFVCHAEMNAITNASNKPELDGASIYVSLFPCNECAKLIVQVGIKEVVYLEDKYHDQDIFVAARKIFDMAGVACRQLKPENKEIRLNLG